VVGDSQFTLLGSARALAERGAVGGALRARLVATVALLAVACGCLVAAGAMRRPGLRLAGRRIAISAVLSVSMLSLPLALWLSVAGRGPTVHRGGASHDAGRSAPSLAAPTTVPAPAAAETETTTTTL